jgi:hypothetical protein
LDWPRKPVRHLPDVAVELPHLLRPELKALAPHKVGAADKAGVAVATGEVAHLQHPHRDGPMDISDSERPPDSLTDSGTAPSAAERSKAGASSLSSLGQPRCFRIAGSTSSNLTRDAIPPVSFGNSKRLTVWISWNCLRPK